MQRLETKVGSQEACFRRCCIYRVEKLAVHATLGKQVCTMNGLKAKNQLCKRYSCSCSVTQSCPAPCGPLDYSPPGSCVHGIFQARILELVDISTPRGPSRPRDWTHCVLFIAGGFFTLWPLKLVAQSCPTLRDPMDYVAHRAPLSMEFPR